MIYMNISKNFKKFFDRANIKNDINQIFEFIGKPIHTDKYLKVDNLDDISNYYFPCYENIFRFANFDINNIKYVVLGMDPYPSYYIENGLIKPVATGRSFEVANISSWKQKTKQASFNNILKSIYYNITNKVDDIETIRNKLIEDNDFNEIFPRIMDKSENKMLFANPCRWFDNMENKGVMWLNATLTVKPNNPDSHTAYWKNFMDELICYIIENNKNIKWLIFGNKAKERVEKFVDKKNMYITCHPACRFNNTFIKDNIFKYIK